MSNFHHLSIDFTEGDSDSYRGVVLKAPDGSQTRWMTGEPVADWASYMTHAKAAGLLVITASSVGHFCWDYPGLRFIEDDDGHEVLVPEDRPAWLDAEPEF